MSGSCVETGIPCQEAKVQEGTKPRDITVGFRLELGKGQGITSKLTPAVDEVKEGEDELAADLVEPGGGVAGQQVQVLLEEGRYREDICSMSCETIS